MYNVRNLKKNWNNKSYQFHMDESKCNTLFHGWLVNKTVIPLSIAIYEGDVLITELKRERQRPRLAQMYPDIPNVILSGFELDMRKLKGDTNYRLCVSFNDEEELISVIEFSIIVPLLYVHIPKTAGSTINKYLKGAFTPARSLIHAESSHQWAQKVNNSEIDYISGHIPYVVFSKKIKLAKYKKLISFREPLSHIASHLAWVRALALDENKNRYNHHPKYIQRLSKKLSLFDFSDPESLTLMIDALDEAEFRLFDNTQTRYIRSDVTKVKVDNDDFNAAIDNLKSFDFIGCDDISSVLNDISKEYNVKHEYDAERVNVNNEKFGLDMTNIETINALSPLIKYDALLYNEIKNA